MKYVHRALRAFAAVAGLLVLLSVGSTLAADGKDLVLRGDAKCTSCHDQNASPGVLTIGQRKHGTRADGRTPSCTTCHGQSERHVNSPADTKPDVVFKGAGAAKSDAINSTCLTCHNGGKRMHWATSRHEEVGVACTNCHSVHSPTDAVQDRRTQPEVCFNCHKQQRTEVNKVSHHPIPEGKMACSDCHNPHGSAGPKNLKRDSVNEVCYQCHMEKRGPFVHEHEPVMENCATCHNPHGTTQEFMLKARPPFLCHQCHTPHGPQVGQLPGQGQNTRLGGQAPLLSATTGGKSGLNYFMARGCLNCHTEIHGTNNPSGNPTPQFFFR